jgi:hypothetical protein
MRDPAELTDVLVTGGDIIVIYGALIDAVENWSEENAILAEKVKKSFVTINPCLAEMDAI